MEEMNVKTLERILEAKKYCNLLQSENKGLRKQTFVDFQKFVLKTDITIEEQHAIFNESNIYILNGFRDNAEAVRTQAIKLTCIFLIDILPRNDYYLSYLFPVLVERLGTCELTEESEEVRLQLLKLLESVIEKFTEDNLLKPFLNDIVMILKETVQDKYPAMKEISCNCIVKLSKALPKDFHLQAETLVKPVLSNFNHRRYKIRCDAIKCIGEIVLNSSHKCFENVIVPMAERLFDQIPFVRSTVAQVGARWMMDYRDRYSYFHKLLPLVLTGLNDEIPETRNESHQLWEAIGIQYQRENENDLKDELDYLTQPPKHYLKNVKRPNLGCRVLVQRNVSKIAKGLANELTSWLMDIRVRCSQLLCAIVLHAEENITQCLQDILPAMYNAARNEDKTVTANIIQASEILGIFVPPETWKKIILPAIEDGAHFGHLIVLAGLIRESPRERIIECLKEISDLLGDASICQSRKKKFQLGLVDCVRAIMSKYDGYFTEIDKNLFVIIVTVMSLRDSENVEHINDKLIEEMCKAGRHESTYLLWSRYCPVLLNDMKTDPKSWVVVSPERCIFETVLLESGKAFGENLPTIGRILIKALDIDADAESRLKTFISLSTALNNKSIIFTDSEGVNEFLEILITDIIAPTLVWHAGLTAEAMRTMAASCLFSTLYSENESVEIFTQSTILRSLLDKLIPLLISLMEDASYRSRQLALQNVVLLKQLAEKRSIWVNEDILKIYPEIIKRLDDPNESVRLCSVESLLQVIQNPPKEFLQPTFTAHHEFIIDTLLIHFDDDDCKLQDLIMGLLKYLSTHFYDELVGKIEKHAPSLRNHKRYAELTSYLNTTCSK